MRTTDSLKSILVNIWKHNKEMKVKVATICDHLLQKDTCVKSFALHVEFLKESSDKLGKENESILAKKQEINEIPMKHQRPKSKGIATKMMVEGPEDQKVGIGLQMESMFSSYCADAQ